jgi:hypothetical protein
MKIKNPTDKAIFVSLTTGFAFTMQPGAEREVKDYVAEVALERGCVPVEGGKRKAKAAPVESVSEAVAAIVEEGDPTKFTKAGKPKVQAVRDAVGQDVPADVVNEAFEELTDGNSNGSD